jgi:hypothetical protein
LRRAAHRWERVTDVMKDATDVSRMTELPARGWAQVSRTVIGAIKDFQLQRMRMLADRPTAIQPPPLD